MVSSPNDSSKMIAKKSQSNIQLSRLLLLVPLFSQTEPRMAERGILCNFLLNTSGIYALWIECQGFYKEFMAVTENCPFNEFTSSNHGGFYRTGPPCSSPDL